MVDNASNRTIEKSHGRLSVVFSFRNEEAVLPELIKRVEKALCTLPFDYELIFVNDASIDGSLEILLHHQASDKQIKIINMSRCFGTAPCIMAGLRYAKGDAAIYMDADLQDPPEVIPRLVEKWQNNVDVVHTIRIKRKGETAAKLWLTKCAYVVIHLLSDFELPRNAGDFKLLSRRALDEVIKLREYDPYMRGLVPWIGFKQEQVFYERDPRLLGRTHFLLWKSLGPIKEFLRGVTSFSVLPLWFALIVGLLTSFGAFLYLSGIVVTKLMGMHLPGWPAVMVTLLFLGGTTLFSIGIVGLYVGRIYQDVKGRPLYIIESKIGFEE